MKERLYKRDALLTSIEGSVIGDGVKLIFTPSPMQHFLVFTTLVYIRALTDILFV